MPAKSEKQKRLMEAVAHNPSFAKKVGIPQSVAKEFVQDGSLEEVEVNKPEVIMPINKNAGQFGRAAGILLMTNEGECLFIRRGNGGDFPGTWCVPGGHQNDGESLDQCARRECFEETGINCEDKLDVLYDDGQFCTYIARNVDKQSVELNYESTGYDWSHIAIPPYPLHPGMFNALKIANAKTEYDHAELIKDDILCSPQIFGNMALLAIRITGTGLAYRSSIGEHVWRDPSIYLNDEFLKRCQGLCVIMDHPDSSLLDGQEFKKRTVGTVMLPYIKGDEVWGIAKIYEEDAIQEILEGDISTSPSVAFDQSSGNTTLTTEGGDPLLVEGVPFLLDHIAIVTKSHGSKGVWDKGGEPAGVLLTNENLNMTENAKADAAASKLDLLVTMMQDLTARMDSVEKNLPAEPLVTAADRKHRKDDDNMKHHHHKRHDDDDDDMRHDDDDMHDDDDDDMKRRKHRKDDDSMKKHHKHSNRHDDEEECEEFEEKFERKDARHHYEGHKLGRALPHHRHNRKDASAYDDHEEEDVLFEDAAKRKDEEESRYADAQAKADSALVGFGKKASSPLLGESLTGYRIRLLNGMKAYSDMYKNVNLRAIKDESLLSIVENQIFADAAVAARNSIGIPSGQLMEIAERDESGRTIKKFKGSMSAWLDAFKSPGMRATSFNTNNKR